MVTYAYALELAKEYLKGSEVPLQITYEGEFSEGWYFCYQSKEFLETGELSTQLAGNAPFLIDRQSGELYILGTAKPIDSYLKDYMKEKSLRLR
ncbi:YrhB family protein [Pseudomonas sp. GD04058]|uniref:YrhB domain-containing protein n=1 Tax=Pseudomonas sp. GD04058 TaxID=2975429 RepID=UPI0002A2C77A|nr:YrhB domain-containing protein [Pseudomonas sp. GD04058]MDG9884248.1 YrhB family protein [Pseudomonas sp. GD04058]